ncbi:MAG: ribbon-helix-helix protein, CopG family [Sterolibacterium sp.]|jgi:predicted transcriptional regulator|nr:ribbon-helix-helix protein, CopG family [Sterolibacterium sp.]
MRLPENLVQQLEVLAKAMGRSRSFVAAEAIQSYVREQAWQVQEMQDAVKEADAGDFATPAETQAAFGKWLNNAG